MNKEPENAIGRHSEAHQVAEVIESGNPAHEAGCLFLFLLVVSVMGDNTKVAASIN